METTITEKTGLPKFINISYFVLLLLFSIYIFNRGYTNTDLYLLISFLVIGILLVSIHLTVKIDDKSIKYRLFPFTGTKKIDWSDIKNFDIQKTDALTNFWGWGLRYSFKHGWGYITNTKYAMYITKKNDKKVVISIKDKERYQDFLKK